MNKKIAILALSLCMIAAIAITGTLAYFTDSDAQTNTFTVGNVDIDLTEPNWEKEGGGEDQGEDAYPGEPLPKDPTVTNIGSNPCFVRIKVEGLNQFVEEFGEGATIDIRNTAGVRGACNEGWTIYGDYIYYNTVLEAGATTEPAAFDYIVIPEELTNVLHGTSTDDEAQPSYDIDVTAYAVQAQGARPSFENGVKKMTVAEIAEWFTTCGL